MSQFKETEMLIARLCNGTLDEKSERQLLRAAQESPTLQARINAEIELATRITVHFLMDED